MYPHERSLVESMQGRPFSLLGVNNDSKISTVKTAIKENDLNWRSWYDGKGGPIVKKFGISSFPTIFVVDHTGVIRYKNLRGKQLEHAIEMLVAEAEAEGSGSSGSNSGYRQYVDSSGQFKINARFVSAADGSVVLEKDSGEKITLTLDKLSAEDQKFLDESGLLAGKRQQRVFTDATGKFSVTATYVGMDGDNVKLMKENGQEVVLALDRLSEDDQRYVRESRDNQ